MLWLWILPSNSSAIVTVTIPDTTAKRDSTINIPIRLTSVTDDIVSAEITLTFDSGILTAGDASVGNIAPGWFINSNPTPGQIKVAMASFNSLTGDGVLATIPFTVLGSATSGDSCIIHFTKCQFNEGNVSSCTEDGVFTVWIEYEISGYVKYYGGSNPGVSDVKMKLRGPKKDSINTGANGYYSLKKLKKNQNHHVKPRKRNTTNDPSVTSFDASQILQHVVEIDTLGSNQQIAGEVSSNGSLSAYDAALILQYAVDKIKDFPVGDWVFLPESTSYTSLNSNHINQNYTAILYGDVTGNWSDTKGLKSSTSTTSETHRTESPDVIVDKVVLSGKTAELTVPNVTGSPGDKITVPINIGNVDGVIAVEITLKYDSDVLTATEVSTTPLTAGYLMQYRITTGKVKIALAGDEPLKDNGTLIIIDFTANESPYPGNSNLELEHVELNEGGISCKATSGMFDITTGVEDLSTLPKEFALLGNYSNPFVHTTNIHYYLPVQSDVSLLIYSVTGRIVKILVKGIQEAGYYNIRWDGKDELGRDVKSGVYFYNMQICAGTRGSSHTYANKVIMLR